MSCCKASAVLPRACMHACHLPWLSLFSLYIRSQPGTTQRHVSQSWHIAWCPLRAS
jgi:hypothetical protein